MKPLNEIIQTPEYKQHVFTMACRHFECGEEQLPSLYMDGFSNRLILYRLRNSQSINSKYDEISIANIPSFLDELMNVDKSLYESLMTIYDTITKIATEYGVDLKESLDSKAKFAAYGINDYSEMWANEEFKTHIRKEADELAKRLEPMQEIANRL